MDIIALVGSSSCGKTTTLNLAYNLLITQGGTSTNKQTLGGDPNDFEDIVIFNGKKIAFYTMGDFSGLLVSAIQKYDRLPCDYLVCACNNRFVNPFKEFAKHHTTIINKTSEINIGLRLAADTTVAQNICSLI